MPAAVRGGSGGQTKSRAKTPPSSRQRPGPRTAGRPSANAHPSGGLSAKWTLVGAAGVLVLALGLALATGHRGETLVARRSEARRVGTGCVQYVKVSVVAFTLKKKNHYKHNLL